MLASAMPPAPAATERQRGETAQPRLARQAPAWVNRYIGLPFLSRGRDRAGCDCWGLLRLVMAEQFGIDLPSYADDYSAAHAAGETAPLIAAHRHEWREIATDLAGALRLAELGDGVLLRTRGAPVHVGVMVARGRMLHIERGIDSCTERLNSLMWRHRFVGLYRHPHLDPAQASTAVQ